MDMLLACKELVVYIALFCVTTDLSEVSIPFSRFYVLPSVLVVCNG